MSARSISRVARTGFAAGALTVALSVPALAVPARDSAGAPVPDAAGVRVTPPTVIAPAASTSRSMPTPGAPAWRPITSRRCPACSRSRRSGRAPSAQKYTERL